jgi:undecaprenyl-diphosphatase
MFYLYLWIAVQIIVEMLPISSSGHLLLLEFLLKKYASFDIQKYFVQEETLQSIYYFLHGPTLLIVCSYFFSCWWSLTFTTSGIAWNLIIYLLIANLISGLIYLFSKKNDVSIPLGLGFAITMILLFSTSLCVANKAVSLINFSDVVILGFAQGLAVLSGISRLAFTCSVGCWLGYSLYDAFFLAWTIQVPLMTAAFAKSCKDLYQMGALKQILNLPIGLVILFSSGVSICIMKLLLQMTQNNTFYLFGWYMPAPLIVWIWLIKFGSKSNVRDIQKSGN